MNGIVYKEIEADLVNTSSKVFDNDQKQKALATIIETNHAKEQLRGQPEAQLIVYVDDNQLAHWAYHIKLEAAKGMPSYIVDASNFKVFQQWNDLRTLIRSNQVDFGGNLRVGRTTYDGLANHLPTLTFLMLFWHLGYMRNDIVKLAYFYTDITFHVTVTITNHHDCMVSR